MNKEGHKLVNWKKLLLIAGIVCVCALGTVVYIMNAVTNIRDFFAPTSATTQEAIASEEKVSVNFNLGSGHYTAGMDIPAGVYDITAVRGTGNVSSDNAYSGGINAIMGAPGENDQLDIYEEYYQNIDLSEGVTLSISGGVLVSLKSDQASGAPLQLRNQSITEVVRLGNGHFVAGEDFPAGVYDIQAISGGGNVSSDNAYSGGINAILGTADKNSSIKIYELAYQNISLPEGVTLSIDGVQIELTPSR